MEDDHWQSSTSERPIAPNSSSQLLNHNFASTHGFFSQAHSNQFAHSAYMQNHPSSINAMDQRENSTKLKEKLSEPTANLLTGAFNACTLGQKEELRDAGFQFKLRSEMSIGASSSFDGRYHPREILERNIANHVKEHDTLPLNRPVLPTGALENLHLYSKMMFQRCFPDHFPRVSESTTPYYPISQQSLHLQQFQQSIQATSRPEINPASGLQNPIQPCPVRLFPTDFRWARSFLPYHHQFPLVPPTDPALLPYSSMMLPRPNRAS